MIKIQSTAMNSGKWESIKDFCFLWDGDLINALKHSLTKMGIPHNDEYLDYISKISQELGALIMQLKNHYQRPRAFQVAYYSHQKFNPFETISGNTPAYPSGHACQGFFLCSVIAHHYPEKKDALMKLASKVADSRIIMGVHYPSDNLFGIQIAKELISKTDILEEFFPTNAETEE
jgi:hypothetical protein